MAYRPEWFPKESILEISMNVVGYIRGSYDTMPEDHALNVRALEWTVKNWDYDYNCGRVGDESFDNTILKLVKIALTMEEIDKEKRGY
jgi:hypothetical protein